MPHANDSRYRETLDSLLEGFQIIGFDWTYRYVNPAAAAQGRSTPEALVGRRMWEVYPGIEKSPLFERLRTAMEERVVVSLENYFAYPDGTSRWFELRIAPVPEGICIHSFDIQERKEAQMALEQINADLESRVDARTRELVLVNEELEAFTASVSHDLRAPVRQVTGLAGMLSEDAAPRLNDADRALLDRIIVAGQRMNRMIDGLLELSRLGRRPLNAEWVDLADVVEQARSALTSEIGEREVEWTVGELPRVWADAFLLQLAMVNLLSNALKYTRHRSPAQIWVEAGPGHAPGETVIRVRDNGVGFSPGAASDLFQPFRRLHPETEFAGTGIGLANVRRIINRHGGHTWAEGAVGQGATFYLSLPAPSDVAA